ncbi:MAG: flagellar hook-associated family protein [Lentilitoribacter sp.]
MKTSFVSSYATQTSMRLIVQRAQAEVQQLQTEAVTGRHADVGVALGGQTSNAVRLHRDFEQFSTIQDTNSLVENRLSSAQAALEQSSQSAQDLLETLIIAKDATDDGLRGVAVLEISDSLRAFTDAGNLTANGEHIFSGINTDTKPLVDYFEPGNAAKTAFDNAFSTYFGFTQTSASTSTITATQMSDFLDNTIEPMFAGTDWTTNWSSASDTNMTSRIAREELVQSSVNTNGDGFRSMAFASTIALEMMNIGLDEAAQSVLVDKAIDAAGRGVSGIDDDRTTLGISQARLEKANNLLQVQADLTKIHVSEMEEVDIYEASTRVNALMAQIETSYSITSRLQQLNLIDYLR